jgi:hypothetical protein
MLDHLPQGRVAWTDPRLKPAWVLLALAAAVYVLVFPFTVSISDEAYYAGQTLALLHGHLIPTVTDALPIRLGHAAETLRYPPGWPLLLAPFRVIGFRPMFVAALLVHLAGGAAMARMLVRRGLPAWLAAAWIFHPVAWVFARTLMSDVPAITFLLLSMDQWEEGKPGRSALALGWSLFTRVGSLMAAAGAGLAVLSDGRRWRDVFILSLGPVAAGLAVVGWNWAAQGSPLGAWYGGEGVGAFTGKQIPLHLLLYAGGLLLLPPFPLACLILRPRQCDRWALAALPPLAFFVFYSYHDASASALETFFGGQRLVLAAHAVLMVATMRVWSRIPLLRYRAAVVALAAACAAAVSFVSRKKLEERFIPAIQAARMCRPQRLAFNELALRVAAAVPAREYPMIYRGGSLPAADVGIVLTREVSFNRAMASGTFELPPAWAATGRCTQAGAFMVFDLKGGCALPPPTCALPRPPSPPPPGPR